MDQDLVIHRGDVRQLGPYGTAIVGFSGDEMSWG